MIKLKTKNHYTIQKRDSKNISIIIQKTDKYEYLTGEEILPSDQSWITEQAKFTYSPLGKEVETSKNNWRTRKKTSWSFRSFKTREK